MRRLPPPSEPAIPSISRRDALKQIASAGVGAASLLLPGAGMAQARGWSGICSSNFCQPHFPGFHKDPAWHQQLTSAIKAP